MVKTDSHAINGKKINNKINEAMHDRKFNNSLKKVGKIAKKQVLPAVVSTAIPLASTALGAVATAYGGPMAGQVVSGMSENLMKEYIPDKYQSKNKYVGMLGNAMNQGMNAMNGDFDPNAMMDLQGQFASKASNDLSLIETKKKQPLPQQQYYQPQYIKPQYDPENPYQDLMQQLVNKSHNLTSQNMSSNNLYRQDISYDDMEDKPVTIKGDSENTANDALYTNAQISSNNMTVTNSPYQQKEGSSQALFGAGLKRRRAMTASQVQKLQDRKTNKYNKKLKAKIAKYPDDDYPELSRAPNPSLEQYLGNTRRRTKKQTDKELIDLVRLLKERL
jgi:hypothetical protein